MSFLNGFKNIAGKACVKRVHNNYAWVNVGKIAYEKNIKHRILKRSVLSADKTPQTNKGEVYRYEVTARDELGQWAYK